ncbi:hypothetical protein FACS189472_07130 [Alphaproteobacteria bacterium]|nr:hypothetical protein FACS189472_07130 [Alphaproteobacteria bacterium]
MGICVVIAVLCCEVVINGGLDKGTVLFINGVVKGPVLLNNGPDVSDVFIE